MATINEILSQPDEPKAKRRPLKSYLSSRNKQYCRVPKEERRDVKESVVQKEIIDFLKSKGAWVIKIPGSHVVGPSDSATVVGLMPGAPDLLACYKGHFLAIEVKAPRAGAMATGEQMAQGDAIQKSGGLFVVAWSVNQAADLCDRVDARTFQREPATPL